MFVYRDKFHIMDQNFRLRTEIWDIEAAGNKIVAPTLASGAYREVGLFLVDVGYCKKT